MVRVLCVCASTCSGPAALPRAASARPLWGGESLRAGGGGGVWGCVGSPRGPVGGGAKGGEWEAGVAQEMPARGARVVDVVVHGFSWASDGGRAWGCGMLCWRSIGSDRTRLEYVREQPRFGPHHGLVFARLQGHGLGAQLQEAGRDGRQCQQMVDLPVHARDHFGRDMAWRVDA